MSELRAPPNCEKIIVYVHGKWVLSMDNRGQPLWTNDPLIVGSVAFRAWTLIGRQCAEQEEGNPDNRESGYCPSREHIEAFNQAELWSKFAEGGK